MSAHEHLAQEDALELALAQAAGSAHAAAQLSHGLASRLAQARACPSCSEALELEQEQLMRVQTALEHAREALPTNGAKLGWPDALVRSAQRVQKRTLAELEARAGTPRPARSRALRLVAASLFVHVLALPLVALWIVREQTLRGQFTARLEPELDSFAPLAREPRGELEFDERDWSTTLAEALDGRPASSSRSGWSLPSADQVHFSRAEQREFLRSGEVPSLVLAPAAAGPARGPKLSELEPGERLEWLACSRMATWRAARGGPLEGALGMGLRLFEGQLLEAAQEAGAHTSYGKAPGATLAQAMELEWALDLLCLASPGHSSAAPEPAAVDPAPLALLGERASELSLGLAGHLSSGPASAAESEFLALVMERALALGVLQDQALGRLRQAWVVRRVPSMDVWDQAWAAALERAVAAAQPGATGTECLRAWLR